MKGTSICARGRLSCRVRARPSQCFDAVRSRAPDRRAPLQASQKSEFSTSAPRYISESAALQTEPIRRKRTRASASVVVGAIASLAAAGWYLLGSGGEDGSLNTTSFTAFDITAREQVSPSAFILSVRCRDEVLSKNAPKVKDAWEHGLWSVEIKQPQLQIARHYTPLPPLPNSDGGDGELRFLIRKMDGGEMSNYLSRLPVGEKVWLRGPHLGFNISKRMKDATDVVFLAGGTGIAPALQMVHKLLDSSADAADTPAKSIRIIWANRKNTDSAGRENRGKGRDTPFPSSLSSQIIELKRQHGAKFNIDYFVDDEKYISLKDVDQAIGNFSGPRKQPKYARADRSCWWHSHDRLAAASDEEDASEMNKYDCTCHSHSLPPDAIGRNLLCVSGPDGFIETLSGPKRWLGGKEIQGPVIGLLGAMKKLDSSLDDWLVLKL
ncbi:hypothetical protein BX600DRAFT_287179 [Xylariales sp. PMI_506]|nr:hypothetical protein BX600DRAFT_287179 [Xylariales sp. PMI_506]